MLLRLADALRSLGEAAEIEQTTCRLLGEHLRVDRAYYVDIDEGAGIATVSRQYVREGAQSSIGVHPLEAFGWSLPAMRRGEMIVVDDIHRSELVPAADVAAMEAVQQAAIVAAPIVRGDALVAVLCVTQSVPRAWKPEEVELVRDVMERTWAAVERARAEAVLRESEERQALLVRFSDAARGRSEPSAIALAACRLLTEKLGTRRAVWARVDAQNREYVANWVWEDGSAGEPSRGPFDPGDPFAAEHLAGRSVVYEDVDRDPRIGAAVKAAMRERGNYAGIAVPVLVAGTLRAVLNTSHGAPRRWYGHEVATVEALAGRAWAEVERAHAETALRESEEKYRTVFESAEEGFLIHEMVRNEAGKVIDYRLLEANPAYQRATGLSRETIGKLGSEFMPHVEQYWLDLFHRVSTSGVAERAEMYNAPTSRWYNVQVSPVRGHDRVAIVFDDVTIRKQAELALKASEERQAFLLKLSDTLRSLADANAIKDAATRLLVEDLGASESSYSEHDGDVGVLHNESVNDPTARIAGRYPLADFAAGMAILRAGRELVIPDVLAFAAFPAEERARWAALQIRATISLPLIKEGKLIATLAVRQTTPRAWTEEDVTLVRETAERTWAAVERARAEAAIRERERELRAAVEERDALLKELHHRVKNNLQVITSLLELQARTTSDRQELSALSEARNRISAISAIHELLYQSGSLSKVDLAAYARRIVRHVVTLYDEHCRIETSVAGDGITVDLARAVPFGLLLNELVSNACKHAFPRGARGALSVHLQQEDGHVQLLVADDGVGLPAGLTERKPSTLGLQLVRMLAKQLGATVRFDSSGGTAIDVQIPLESKGTRAG